MNLYGAPYQAALPPVAGPWLRKVTLTTLFTPTLSL
jgi:hypothetical protein